MDSGERRGKKFVRHKKGSKIHKIHIIQGEILKNKTLATSFSKLMTHIYLNIPEVQ